MDVAKLLLEARDVAGITQVDLAARAGISKTALCRYERSTASPTVAVLDGLLAAAGLQVRVSLEPLLADVDLRLDEMLASSADVDRVAAAVGDDVAGEGCARAGGVGA